MQISFFGSFAKKVNSTKAPLVTDATRTLTGYLIEPCSIMNPTFKIERFASDASPQSYTYAYISEFARFYFVEDWTWADGLWLCKLKEDVLASFKTAIGNTTEYILRTDSTTDFNGEITDITYPGTTDVITNSFVLNNAFSTSIYAGCYVVGIISGNNADAVGAITYYAMTSAEFGAFKAKLFSDDNLEIMGIIDSHGATLIQDVSEAFMKTLYNPFQYISSCFYFPFGKSAIPTATDVTTIPLGWWNYPLNASIISAQTFELGAEQFAITAHPQASRGSYLNYAPYTRRAIVGRFGTIPIDTFCFDVGEKIDISYLIDIITGQCCVKISVRNESTSPATHKLINESTFLVGVPIQIAQIGMDYLGMITNAVTTYNTGAQQVLSANIGGAVSTVYNGIDNAMRNMMPQLITSGQNGSFLAPANETHVVEQFYQIVDEDIQHRGRPLCELRQINTLSGFILCAEGDMDISCYDNERKEITRFLTTGFFWE